MSFNINNSIHAMQQFMRRAFVDFQPHEYCIGAVFIIAIGFVMLNGRK